MSGIALQTATSSQGASSGAAQGGKANAGGQDGFALLLAALGGGAQTPATPGLKEGTALSQSLASGLPLEGAKAAGLNQAAGQILVKAPRSGLEGQTAGTQGQEELLAGLDANLAVAAQVQPNQIAAGPARPLPGISGKASAAAPGEPALPAQPAGDGQAQSKGAGQSSELADLLAAARQPKPAQNSAQNPTQNPAGNEAQTPGKGAEIRELAQSLGQAARNGSNSSTTQTAGANAEAQAAQARKTQGQAQVGTAATGEPLPAGEGDAPELPARSAWSTDPARTGGENRSASAEQPAAARTANAQGQTAEASGASAAKPNPAADKPGQAQATASTPTREPAESAQSQSAANDAAQKVRVAGEGAAEPVRKAAADGAGQNQGQSQAQNQQGQAAAAEVAQRNAARREKVEIRTAAAQARIEAIAQRGERGAAAQGLQPAAAANALAEAAGSGNELPDFQAALDGELAGEVDSLLSGKTKSDGLAPLSGSQSQTVSGTAAAEAAAAGQRGAPPSAAQQVAMQISRSVGEGVQSFSIQLDPADLGKVDVTLEFQKDGKLHATVRVERPETYDMLQRDLQSLEKALKESGADLASLDLSLDLGAQAREGGEQDDSGGDFASNLSGATTADGEAEAEPGETPRQRSAEGLVDISV